MDRHRRSSRYLQRTLFAVPLILALSTQALAQSQPTDLAAQLAALETKLSDPAIETKSCVDLAHNADDLRARLIARHPGDHRAATWLVDRAAYQLDLAAATGLDLVCIFGLPTPAQSDQVRPFAQAALDLTQQADTAAAAAITALEARLLDRTNPPAPGALAEIEARLAVLVETEQARRIPTLRAMGRTLSAATTADPASAATIANKAAEELSTVPATAPAVQAVQELALGEALIHSARDSARAAETLMLARTKFAAANERTSDPRVRLRARLGLLRTGAPPTPPQPSPATPSPAERQLEAETIAAFLVASAGFTIAERAALIADACRTLMNAAPTAEQIAAGAPDSRVLLCEKIAAILPRTVPIASLPPEAAFARAVTMARAAKANDPAARDEIAGLFAHVADRADAPTPLRCAARWERAVVLAGSSDEFAAFDALSRVFTEGPSCPEAVAAAERTAETFISKNLQGSTISPQWLLRIGVYRAALLLLLDRRADDRWRAAFVRLAASEMARPPTARGTDGLPDDFARATQLAAAMSTDAARASALATLADGLTLHMDRRRAEALAAPDAAAAWASFTPTARAALEWTRTHDPPRIPLATLLVGETLAYSGNPEAIAVLAPLVDGTINRPDSPLFIRLRFALAKAQRLNKEDAKAFTTLREAADRLEGAPGTKTRDPAFWAAWAEMLAILQSMNTDGSRTEDLRVQIKRLELLDPTLGGPPHAEAIRKIRDLVKP